MPYNPFPADFIEARRIQLVEQRISCRAQLEHLNDPVDDGGDIIDRTEVELARRARAETYNRIMKELAEIDAALTRVERGTYGICELTGQPIPMERLEAVPTARYDLSGQKKYEKRAQKQSFLQRMEAHAQLSGEP